MGQGEASWGQEPSDSLRKAVTGLEAGGGGRPGPGVGGTDYSTFAAQRAHPQPSGSGGVVAAPRVEWLGFQHAPGQTSRAPGLFDCWHAF